MSNSTARTHHLKSLLELEEKRAGLQQQIDEIHHQISIVQDQIFTKAPTLVANAIIRKVVPKRRARRGALKAQIMAALENAGHAGVRVTELASTLGTKATNL